MTKFLPNAVWAVFAWTLLFCPGREGHAATPLSVTRVAAGLNRPVFVTAPAGDINRLFVVEQHTGRIRILDLSTRTVRPDPFITISGITTGNEQGLLGLAFHPGYATNGFFFVDYTASGGGVAGHTEIVRFQSQGDPRTALTAGPATKSILLTFPQPEENHNGGWVAFGPDGYLYISTGDGGGGNDLHGTIGNAQNRAVLLGKVLRIDVDSAVPYAIPDGNPFKGMAGQQEEIWAFGLRNPWRCSFDRLTGDLWIGDVGQSTREEIDFLPAGEGGLNFGWRPREGAIQNPAYPGETPVTAPVSPVYDYPRSLGIAVTGGYVYRGQSIADLRGTYVFADYGSARFWSLQRSGATNAAVRELTAELNPATPAPKPIGGPSSFGEDAAGELYICDLSDGEIYKIVSARADITIVDMAVNANALQFAFTGSPEQPYIVESREALDQGTWQTLTNLTATAGSTNLVFRDPLGSTQRFYRVRTP